MHIEPKFLIGRKFYISDPSHLYVAAGFAQNDTLLIIGEEVPTNPGDKTTKFKSFKMTDCQFLIPPEQMLKSTQIPGQAT